MVFSRILRNLIRDKELGRTSCRSSRTRRDVRHGPLFKEVGIYSALGQRYEPVDSTSCCRTARRPTARCSRRASPRPARWPASGCGTSYSTHGMPMIPFYIFYSMFGFQRTGDQMWAFGDARGRGFLMGATAGRTTLTGEGLQHDDGHTHIHADDPEHPRLRPGVRVRARGDRPRRRRAHVREGRGRLLLRHDPQRELRPAAAARGRRRP